jgi:catechol 2,3-dioxygenase-like lactoylglutathione lyase family enzyme
MMHDKGWTHIALPVSDLDCSIEFYSRYAAMRVVHRRERTSMPEREVAWLSDLTRPFVLVLMETAVDSVLGPFAHLGVACESREEVDRLANEARLEGCFRDGPLTGGPAGYLVNLTDPDGHTLELSYGQDVGAAIEKIRASLRANEPRD